MIIQCPNCNKKFNVDESLIPEIGRNLVCGSCNHKWFFKKEEELISTNDKKNQDFLTKSYFPSNEDQKKNDFEIIKEKKQLEKVSEETKNIKINKPSVFFKFFSYLVVLLISIIALIIILDTFKTHLNVIFPGFEFQLSKFYELIKDLKFFFNLI